MELSYNGILFPYPDIIRFTQRPLRDDSDTDWYITEFDIQAQFTIHANYLPIMAPELSGLTENAGHIVRYLRQSLYKDRQALSLKVNGQEQIERQAGLPGTVDSRNGPKVQTCEMMYLTETSWLLSFHVTSWLWEKTEGVQNLINAQSNNVLANRWTETVDIDDLGYSTRTRSGKYVIRSDNPAGIVADQARSAMAVVGVPPGFLRKSSSYTVDPSGLGIAYNIVDYEVFKLPPAPAFRAEGQAAYIFAGDGGKRSRSVSLTLYANHSVSQTALITTAMAVATAKINLAVTAFHGVPLAFGAVKGLVIPSAVQVSVPLYENTVTVQMEGIAEGPGRGEPGRLGTIHGVFPQTMAFTPYPPGTDVTPTYYDRGTAGLLLQAAAYWDPSLVDSKLQGGSAFAGDNPPTTTGVFGKHQTPGKQPGQTGRNPG